MRPTKLFIGSLAALAVLLVALTTALFLLDLDVFRGQIEAAGAEAFDRQLTIAGSIRLKPSLQPLLVVEDVRIGNPEWASRPDFAHVERLGVRVALLPLLRGEWVVLAVIFSGADVLLEVGAGDRNNFTFGRRRGPPELPNIDQFHVRDTVLASRDADGQLHRCAVKEAEVRNTPGQPISLGGQLAFRDVPLQFALSAGTPEAFESRTSRWPVELAVSAEDTALVAEGSLPKPRTWDGAEFRVSVQGENVDVLESLFDVVLPVPGPFDLSAELRKSAEAYSVSGLEGRIRSTDIAGELEWEQAGDRTLLKGTLTSSSMRFELAPVSWTPRIARKCGRSVSWRNGSDEPSRRNTRPRSWSSSAGAARASRPWRGSWT